MANLKQYTDIMHELAQGKYKPIYLLHGIEPYYIDRVSKYIELHGVEEHERDFNLSIFYGRDAQADQLLESLKRFPMMAERQVVILREAQDFNVDWTLFEDYFAQPIPSTIFVIDYKYKKVDERKKWVKRVKETGVVMQSPRHYDNELPAVITELTQSMKYRINPAAAMLMAEYLGNDLEKIEGELKKLMIKVPLSQEITQNDVRENIGISKEYSPYDYVDALSVRDAERSFRIAHFMGKNTKSAPYVMVISALFNHFTKVLIYHMLPDKSTASVIKGVPGVSSPWLAGKLKNSTPHYSAKKAAAIIEKLREMDARFKGVNSATVAESDLYKELTFFILN